MLVSAFSTRENILNAYNEAVKEKYRFFSFGDAMFIKQRFYMVNVKLTDEERKDLIIKTNAMIDEIDLIGNFFDQIEIVFVVFFFQFIQY